MSLVGWEYLRGMRRVENNKKCGGRENFYLRDDLAEPEACSCAWACEVGRAGGTMAPSQVRRHSLQGGR